MNIRPKKPLFVAVAAALAFPPFIYSQDLDQGNSNSSDADIVEEVIVEGIRSAEMNARQIERDKKAFSSVISQDDAGDFADQNVAEALQRLPGITLQKSEGEGQYVTLRGLGPGFVSVTMNGSELASAGGAVGGSETRAFSLDALPVDMLSSVEVLKSLTPDMDLNSIGGTINVKTISAFDRDRDSLKGKIQTSYQTYKEEFSPKVALDGTNLFLDKKLGVGYSLSWEKRDTVNYEVLHHDTTLPIFVWPRMEGEQAIIPFEYQARQEDAERTRMTGSLDLAFRPNDSSEYYVKFSRTEYEDLDIALREYYRFSQADAFPTEVDEIADDEITFVDPDTGLFGMFNTDLQHQLFIQDGTSTTTAFSVGGENTFADHWVLDYNVAHSVGEFEKPNGRRVQFRSRGLPMVGLTGSNFILGQVVSGDVMEALSGVSGTRGSYGISYLPGTRRQEAMQYDNIFIEDSFRTDTLDDISINLRREFSNGLVNFVKFGVSAKSRERDRNKDRWSVVPNDIATALCPDTDDPELCRQTAGGVLGDFATFTPAHPDIRHDMVTYTEAERILAITSPIARAFDPDRVEQESTTDDYLITEDTLAAYLMAEFDTSEHSSLIAGVRYEETDFASTGNFSIRNDRFEDFSTAESFTGSLDVVVPLEETEHNYDNWFPSVHYRYEPREDVLVRAALWTSYTRPSFSQARAYAEIDGRVILCDGRSGSSTEGVCSDNPASQGATLDDLAESYYVGANNTINVGNTKLDPMTAVNLDTSISWYASENLFVQAAFFYKDIDNFIVDVSGANSSLENLPIDIPYEQVTDFSFLPGQVYSDINYSINGESAKVYGIELSYSHFFNNGLFVQSNLTLMDSTANVGDSIRTSEIQLPDQADETFNLAVGWENEDISARVIGNYRSRVLERIGACSAQDIAADNAADNPVGQGRPYHCLEWADIYHDNTLSVDFKATWQLTDMFKLYFDAVNLTEDKSLRYFEGNEYSRGRMFFYSEDFGTSYQLGVNIKFM